MRNRNRKYKRHLESHLLKSSKELILLNHIRNLIINTESAQNNCLSMFCYKTKYLTQFMRDTTSWCNLYYLNDFTRV